MATDEKKKTRNRSSAKAQTVSEPFAGMPSGEGMEADLLSLDTREQLSEHEVFVGDEDFYKLLAESSQELPAPEQTPRENTTSRRRTKASSRSKRLLRLVRGYSRMMSHFKQLSSVQKILIAAIVVVALMLAHRLLQPAGRNDNASSATSADRTAQPTVEAPSAEGPAEQAPVAEAPQAESPLAEAPAAVQSEVQKPSQSPEEHQAAPLPTESMSLEVARNLFAQKQYDQARAVYEQLRLALPISDTTLRDFLQLEMALCEKQAGNLEQASHTLTAVSQSPSPAVRTIANYQLSLLEIERKRFLMARTRAYNALALVQAVDFDHDWALSFECDCHFLVAACLSRQILMLGNTETDLPADLWGAATAATDPFARLKEPELRALLNSGSEHLNAGLLDPKIQKVDYQGETPQWSISSYGAPVEELLAKFVAAADLDLQWSLAATPDRSAGTDVLRQRPVSMHLPAATPQQVVLMAAGCAGLLASTQDNSSGKTKVSVCDPGEYASLDEHLTALSRHAVSLWQKFVLTFYSDARVANAHFVMGLLQSQVDLPAEAIAEFKLVANRFSRTSLAPYALLHSSKLKTTLRDHQGARDDLKQLIEQYPDTEIYGQASLRLADATLEAGLKAEAAKLYQRVYNVGLSPESKATSALGAARCFYDTQAYADAAQWLTSYIRLAGESGSSNLYPAHYMLGRSCMAMKQYKQACSAFEAALAAQSSREQYVETITALIKAHIEQEQFVEAMDALESVGAAALSEEQSIEILLLKCRILRMMGLVDAASVLLRDRVEYVSDVQLNARISFELAQCHIAEGDLERARSRLSEVLGVAEAGELAQTTAVELAGVCLKLGRSDQSISVCLKLLDSDVPPQIRQQMLKTLAAAYRQQKDYDKAALALSGQWK